MHSRLFHRPEIHSPGEHAEKRPSWLELFYDLIFVAVFVQLGNSFASHLHWQGTLAFVGLSTLMWLTWAAFTEYSNHFQADDLAHRLLVFLQIFALAGSAIFIGPVFERDTSGFAIFYAFVRLVFVVLYARTYWLQKRARDMTGRYAIGYILSTLMWTGSIFLSQPWVFLAWGLAAGTDLLLPFSKSRRIIVDRYPPDVRHLSRRYGILTIIILGEAFLKILNDFASVTPEFSHLLMGFLVLLIVCSLWWSYFDDVAGSKIKPSSLAGMSWIYAHIPLTISFVAAGVFIEKALFFPVTIPLPEAFRWLLCTSLAMVFVSLACIDSLTEHRQSEFSNRSRVATRLLAAVALLALTPASSHLPAWITLLLVALACLSQVVVDLIVAPTAPDTMSMEEAQQPFSQGNYNVASSDARNSDVASTPKKELTTSNAVRKGAPSELRRDLYFHLMSGSWSKLFGYALFFLLFSNALFASLYLLEPGSIGGAGVSSFSEAFNFSVQTMFTIGYGALSPNTPYANVLVVAEAFTGLFLTAVTTGLIFAKASRPGQSILFSKVAVLTTYDGKPTMMFRVGNAKGNEIVEASISVSVLKDEMSPEGHRMRRMRDVKLVRASTPLFTLSWQVLHVIDEDSPFFGVGEENVEAQLRLMIVTMMGHDVTYAQTVHGRSIYQASAFRFGHHFVDVVSDLDDGRLLVNYEVFHDTLPDEEKLEN